MKNFFYTLLAGCCTFSFLSGDPLDWATDTLPPAPSTGVNVDIIVGPGPNSGEATAVWADSNCESVLRGSILLGPRFYLANSRNNGTDMKHQNYACGGGGMGGFGLDYLYRNITLNAILNLSFGNVRAHHSKKHVKTSSTQVGGVLIGGGLGWEF